MQLRASLIAACICLANGIRAVYQDQAGLIDWHLQLIGTPTQLTFHRPGRGTFIYAITDRNVLAAINPRHGDTLWRHVYDDTDVITKMRVHGKYIATLSGNVTSRIKIYEAVEGRLIWDSKPASLSSQSPPGDIAIIGDQGAVLSLTDGYKITKYEGSGRQAWQWAPADQGSSTLWYRVADGGDDSVFVIGLTSSFRSYTLEIVELNSGTGQEKKRKSLKSSISHPNLEIIYSIAGTPFVVWVEGSTVKAARLGDSKILSQPIKGVSAGQSPLEIIYQGGDVGLHFAVVRRESRSTTAEWFEIDDESNALKSMLSISSEAEMTTFSMTRDTKNDNVYLCVAKSDPSGLTLLLHDQSGKLKEERTLVYNGVIVDGLIDINVKTSGQINSRFATIKADGTFEMLMSDAVQWSRDEGLAHTVDAVFVELPEHKLFEQGAEAILMEAQNDLIKNLLSRFSRHIVQLQDLPGYVIKYVKRLATGDYDIRSQPETGVGLFRDPSGLRQLLVLAGKRGKIVAMDTANKGKSVWSIFLPDAEIRKVFLEKSSGVTLSLVVLYVSGGRTHLATFDPLTGIKHENSVISIDGVFEHFFEVIPNTILFFDSQFKVHIYPDNEEARKSLASQHVTLSIVDTGDAGDRLQGYHLNSNLELQKTWSIQFPKGEKIERLATPSTGERVASLGRVLGNRQVLYKYLNPNVISILTTMNTDALTSLTVYLVEVVKGSILHEVSHKDVILNVAPHLVMTENWVVYSYYSNDHFGVKGQTINVFEAYESLNPNDRFPSPSNTSLAFDPNERPQVLSQSYVFSQRINAMGITTTRNGITTKEVIVHTESGQLMGISRRLLDPRRPTKALTNDDKEEMLIPYEPVIQSGPHMALSHVQPVLGIKEVKTAPSLLESTCLVVAYGLDVFFTRASPSKTFDVLSEDFSKGMLIATIVALIIGIITSGTLVKSKQLRLKWYS